MIQTRPADTISAWLAWHTGRDGSPFGSFSAKIAVAALAAWHTRARSGEAVSGGGGGAQPSRPPRRQYLLAAMDGYGGSFGAEETHLATSGVRSLHGDEKKTERRIWAATERRIKMGSKEGRKEGRIESGSIDIDPSTDRPRHHHIDRWINSWGSNAKMYSNQTPRRSAAAIKIHSWLRSRNFVVVIESDMYLLCMYPQREREKGRPKNHGRM